MKSDDKSSGGDGLEDFLRFILFHPHKTLLYLVWSFESFPWTQVTVWSMQTCSSPALMAWWVLGPLSGHQEQMKPWTGSRLAMDLWSVGHGTPVAPSGDLPKIGWARRRFHKQRSWWKQSCCHLNASIQCAHNMIRFSWSLLHTEITTCFVSSLIDFLILCSILPRDLSILTS